MEKKNINRDQLVDQMMDIIWPIFQEMRAEDEPSQILYSQQQSSMSYIMAGEEEVPMTNEEAREKLKNILWSKMNDDNRVYIYTCRDNQLITIESFNAKQMIGALEDYEKQEELPLYIGFD